MKKIISGLQATNSLTLGNYIGSIKSLVELQDNNNLYVFVADLHSITVPIDTKDLEKNRKSIVCLYKACGLDFDKSRIFYQSSVIEHSHLAYLLMCNSNLGELNRMNQFKNKSLKQSNKTETIPTGLLIYPCLMAADILLYDADIVPVGNDQKQHIELTKILADRFNKKYKSQIFKIPEFFPPKVGGKIMDLLDPTVKMSKSSKNKNGTIFLLDKVEDIRNKIMGSKTDSLNNVKFDIENQPGISNLLTIYSSLSGISIKELEKKYIGKNYGELKRDIADIVCNFIKDIQNKYNDAKNDKKTDDQLKSNADMCKKEANHKIKKIHKIMGLEYGH
ncbi:MAG: tryptophan--tRNA ligase [Mycoplasmoidaceae bacterium]